MTTTTLLRARLAAGLQLDERITATLYMAVGALVVYLVMFDQGQVIALLLGSNIVQHNLLHEFFHDGRHLGSVPCH
ncbi:MAG TPA: CbtB-domain containing protein [Gaiellaceae bacterium]|nr:CbtB-domain containing protein [Gaiellaceae bacterium]